MPNGIARREFIKNMAGNYLIFNNETKEVKGTSATTYGYRGSRVVNVVPQIISNNADNGTTYEISNWFDFNINSLYSIIASSYPKFHALVKKAGYSDDKLSRYTFISDNQNYTVFVPTDSVMNTINTDVMTLKELQNFILFHFIQGDIIFTDGHRQAGYYETARIDESSTQFNTVYTRVRIIPGIDQITIPNKDGSNYLVVNESLKSNMIMGRSASTTGTEAFPNVVSTGAVHEIKKAMIFEQLDTTR